MMVVFRQFDFDFRMILIFYCVFVFWYICIVFCEGYEMGYGCINLVDFEFFVWIFIFFLDVFVELGLEIEQFLNMVKESIFNFCIMYG